MDAPNSHAWIQPVPNLLSGLRLALAGVFPFLVPWARPWTLLVGGLSDLLDGWIARRFHATSWIGGLLDAVADKAFVLSALGTRVAEGDLEWPLGLLLLSRDVAVLLAAGYGAGTRRWHAFRHMPSRFFGKLTTALLFPLFVAWYALPAATWLHDTLFWAAAGSSFLAALDYGRIFLRGVRDVRRGIEPGAAGARPGTAADGSTPPESLGQG